MSAGHIQKAQRSRANDKVAEDRLLYNRRILDWLGENPGAEERITFADEKAFYTHKSRRQRKEQPALRRQSRR